MGKDTKKGKEVIKIRGMGNFPKEKLSKIKFIEKYNNIVHNKWLYHLRIMFHENIGMMSNCHYVFSASNHQYKKFVSCLLYCSYDNFTAIIS